MTGMAGHWAAVGLVLVAGLAFATSLIVRPPLDAPAVAWRLALGLAVLFALAPATRWGYFVYPIGLLGWLVLTRPPSAAAPADSGGPVRRGIASLGVPAQAGKSSVSATAR
jgi:phosphatidylinositol alpha-1,6-mannosyltransferase